MESGSYKIIGEVTDTKTGKQVQLDDEYKVIVQPNGHFAEIAKRVVATVDVPDGKSPYDIADRLRRRNPLRIKNWKPEHLVRVADITPISTLCE